MALAGKPNPQPLPANDYPDGSNIRTAYDACLLLEQSESWNIFTTDLQKDYSESILKGMIPRVAARVLGYGLRFAPSETGRGALVRDIDGCDRDPELLGGLAHLYVYGLIRVCTFSRGCVIIFCRFLISSSLQSKRPFTCHFIISKPQAFLRRCCGAARAFDQETLDHISRIARAGELVRSACCKPTHASGQLTIRDENRCVFTGGVDYSALYVDPSPTNTYTTANVAHIISQSLTSDYTDVTSTAAAKVVFSVRHLMW